LKNNKILILCIVVGAIFAVSLVYASGYTSIDKASPTVQKNVHEDYIENKSDEFFEYNEDSTKLINKNSGETLEECYEDLNKCKNPQSISCPACGGRFMLKETNYYPWQKTGKERKCEHGFRFGTDVEVKRLVVKVYQCDHCGECVTITDYEYEWECHGYN
jgi:DNA-directed RNA polymerase subunit RPC12/RpoP